MYTKGMNLVSVDLGQGAFLLLPPLLILLVLIVLIFEVWMFVDAIQNPELTQTDRLLWCLGMVFIHPIVAIAYYFVVFSKRNNR